MLAACGRLPTSSAAAPSSVSISRTIVTRAAAAARMQGHAAATAAAAAGGQQGPPPGVFVYSGPGAGTRSVLSTLHSLREALVPAVKVASLDTSELLAGGWREGCLLLVMPGGADLPYCKHLDGRGNALIREYVEGGGSYMGLCAGAYYACARVEFEPGTRLEVVGDRELAFFPGTAAGSIIRGFEYESEDGAVAAPLTFLCLDGNDADGAGGSERQSVAQAQQQQQQQQHAANGAPATGSSGGWEECIDYVNGGPGFLPVLPGMQQQQQQQQQAQSQQQQQQQHPCEQLQGVSVLATYPQHGHTAAALLCEVGTAGGRAVLCGSHPELHPSWLSGRAPEGGSGSGREEKQAGAAAGGAVPGACVDSVSNRAAAASALAADWSSAEHVQRLQAALTAGRRQRVRFWRSLLIAAGLRDWLH